jgi:hypothetical protein
MKTLKSASLAACLALLAPLAGAHEGHGIPGSVGHDLQHQVWTFAALVVVGALLMAGDNVVTLLRNRIRRRDDDTD